MKKIPTLFVRDENDRRYVTEQVSPGCEWVLAGEGVSTRKFDGTCVKWDGTQWWARREVKPGKQAPAGFVLEQADEVTGKSVGWEPAVQSSFISFLIEADQGLDWNEGTYELCGPKINGNPEGFPQHVLVPHGDFHLGPDGRTHGVIREYLRLAEDMEGLVYHHPDGRMVKIKRRDFRYE